jgi:RNA polymerase sigma-70 factor (ECF subfamily)
MEDRSNKNDQKDYSLLHSAIKELPPRLASVIQLQYFDKLSYKEIAEKLGISVKAVESLLVRAKKRLRKKLMKDRMEGKV